MASINTKDGFHEFVEEHPNQSTVNQGLESDRLRNVPSPALTPLNTADADQRNSAEQKMTSSHIADITAVEPCPFLKAVYYSPYYKYFYLAMLVLTVVLTIWLVVDYKDVKSKLFLRKES